MVHGQVGQYLPVEGDVVSVQLVYEFAVTHAVLTNGSIDAGYPQRAEVALLLLAVAVAVHQRLVHRILRYGMYVLPASEVAFGLLQHLFPPGLGGYTIY